MARIGSGVAGAEMLPLLELLPEAKPAPELPAPELPAPELLSAAAPPLCVAMGNDTDAS
jgi:hypothetical protein